MDPDPNLPGEKAETPAATPAETKTPDEGTPVSSKSAASLSPEEERWNALSGHAQSRFKEVAQENINLRRELEEERRNRTQSQPEAILSSTGGRTPEVEAAVQRLSQVGIATDEKVQHAVDQRIAALVYQQELARLEDKFTGDDGRPKFDRDEYQDFVARHPQYRNYAPEDVYQKMYEPELFEWKTTNTGKRTPSSATPSLRPTKTQVREEPLTPELIEQRLSQSDGKQWYEQHVNEIQAVLSKTATPTW